jgi:hypothetical protein
MLKINLDNRSFLVKSLKGEIYGPDPIGPIEEISQNQLLGFPDYQRSRVQLNGQEILFLDRPTKRYGTGVLYPANVVDEDASSDIGSEIPDQTLDQVESQKLLEKIKKISGNDIGWTPDDDLDINLSNAYKPSVVGISFFCDLSKSKEVNIKIHSCTRISGEELDIHPCGFYERRKVLVGDGHMPNDLWLRKELLGEDGAAPLIKISAKDLLNRSKIQIPVNSNFNGLELLIISRELPQYKDTTIRLVTVTLSNKRSAEAKAIDETSLFQSGITISVDEENLDFFMPYPDNSLMVGIDDKPLSDERINSLLFRGDKTFAVGHGCAADWKSGRPQSVDSIWTDYIPVFETPSVGTDLLISSDQGQSALKVSMRDLAGLTSNDGMEEIGLLIYEYQRWIEAQESEIQNLTNYEAETAKFLIERCKDCLSRIKDGIDYLNPKHSNHENIAKAFRLANHAMFLSQVINEDQTEREPLFDKASRLAGWSREVGDLKAMVEKTNVGYWRPFQIAFLLMSLRGIVEPESDDREIVDLIWFATGGGKTEAYLGLTAFTLFFNALEGKTPDSTSVLMRYTLRLLTAQQFERASVLICAMEYLRGDPSLGLGDKPFSIGLWVGSSSTPNSRDSAKQALSELRNKQDAQNPFVILKCPWCKAKFGKVHHKTVFGYKESSKRKDPTVVYRCEDPKCHFGGDPKIHPSAKDLPIVVIDEDIYAKPPSLLIGTVDKFALLAWNPKARGIFGINSNGDPPDLSPSLIIQDELHLISGPLGSMVGAYETIIEELCKNKDGVAPKIIASTATISRADEQIMSLYGRDRAMLFPPSGINSSDSFFSKEKDGPGRLYVGVLPTGYGSLQTSQVRCFSSVMQAARMLGDDPKALDPWWTLLIFFNSIRELGGASTLFYADIRERINAVASRFNVPGSRRRFAPLEELTSRMNNDEIPKILAKLQKEMESFDPKTGAVSPKDMIDVCLASNIIEVGVDVSRLALMAIVGQPKTTSQYIQVSSRVGRSPSRPGLVLMLYGQSKPRDRSHYEKFRTYHQKLYSQVEPTSVTPFSPPAIDRALHGLMVSYVRQRGRVDYEGADPQFLFAKEGLHLIEEVKRVIQDRVAAINPSELKSVSRRLEERLDQWRDWDSIKYGLLGKRGQSDDPELLHQAGGEIPESWNGRSWATLSSLRNVDANCDADITSFYADKQGGE